MKANNMYLPTTEFYNCIQGLERNQLCNLQYCCSISSWNMMDALFFLSPVVKELLGS